MEVVTIYVDDTPYTCTKGERLMNVLDRYGVLSSPLCHHPQLQNTTKAHMCFVELIETESLVEACRISVDAEMKVKTHSQAIEDQKQKILRYINAHHPPECLDCPKTGNCHLQTATFVHGGPADAVGIVGATFRKKALNPWIDFYPDRCIQCGLCTAFMDQVAGSSQLQLMRDQDGFVIDMAYGDQLEAGVSGNLVDLCPSGAIVKAGEDAHFYPNDIKKSMSIDVMDGCGAKTLVTAHKDKVVEISAPNDVSKNHFWISDKARFSVDGLIHNRALTPMMKKEGKLEPVSWIDAFKAVVRKVADLKPEQMAFLAGDGVDVETLYLLRELLDDMGVSHRDMLSRPSGLPFRERGDYLFNTSFEKLREADACLIVGHAPNRDSPLLKAYLHPYFRNNEAQIATVGVEDERYASLGPFSTLEALAQKKHPFFEVLCAAKNPAIIVGDQCLNGEDGKFIYEWSRLIAKASGCIREDWNGFNIMHSSITTVGGLDVGFYPSKGGWDTESIKRMVRGRQIKLLYLMHAEDLPFGSLEDTFIIYQGHHMDKGAQHADIVLPSCVYTEKNGLYINTEGRCSFVERAVPPLGEAKEDWKIIRALSEVLGYRLPYNTYAQVSEAVRTFLSAFQSPENGAYNPMSEEAYAPKTPKRTYVEKSPILSNNILKASIGFKSYVKLKEDARWP